jgi:hypothetical protein
MEEDYKKKYLEYKVKYIELKKSMEKKNQSGGGLRPDILARANAILAKLDTKSDTYVTLNILKTLALSNDNPEYERAIIRNIDEFNKTVQPGSQPDTQVQSLVGRVFTPAAAAAAPLRKGPYPTARPRVQMVDTELREANRGVYETELPILRRAKAVLPEALRMIESNRNNNTNWSEKQCRRFMYDRIASFSGLDLQDIYENEKHLQAICERIDDNLLPKLIALGRLTQYFGEFTAVIDTQMQHIGPALFIRLTPGSATAQEIRDNEEFWKGSWRQVTRTFNFQESHILDEDDFRYTINQ